MNLQMKARELLSKLKKVGASSADLEELVLDSAVFYYAEEIIDRGVRGMTQFMVTRGWRESEVRGLAAKGMLDTYVKEICTADAEETNKNGLQAQVEYLLSCGVQADDILTTATNNVGSDSLVECSSCGDPAFEGDVHRHQDSYVCDECWDERLRTTE